MNLNVRSIRTHFDELFAHLADTSEFYHTESFIKEQEIDRYKLEGMIIQERDDIAQQIS